MKKSLRIFLIAVGSLLSFLTISTAFASSNQSAYQHTYYNIINNTGASIYLSNPGCGGTWKKHIPTQTAMKVSVGTYRNVLTSLLVSPYSDEIQGQADVVVCTDPMIYQGQAYCFNDKNFCTLYTDLDSKYSPHYITNINKQSGDLICTVTKQITSDGMIANFVLSKS